MNTTPIDTRIRQAQAIALVSLPALWLLMLVLHFRTLAQFFVLRTTYVPAPTADTVHRLIEARNRWPMIHDPHLIGYLSLPVLLAGAFGLYALGRTARPGLALLGLCLTVTGTIYLGGVFGLFTALMRGLGEVDPAYADGATATYAAATADRGAYGLTRALAELTMPGIALQALASWRRSGIARHATLLVVAGCALFVAFWDIDNLMCAGALCLCIGFVPHARALWGPGSVQ